MSRNSEEERVRVRVRKYLDGAVTNRDGRSLAVRAVAQFVPCSPTTIYKYGCEKDVEKTIGILKGGRISGQKSKKEKALEARTLAAEAKAAEMEKKYNNLLGRLIQIEYHLRGHPAVDLDAIYNTPIPPPDRSSPYQPTRNRPKI